MKLKRIAQWAHALFDTATFQCVVARVSCIRSIWRSVSALWSLRRSDMVEKREWLRRIRRCQKCPIYDHALKRCHSSLYTYVDEGVTRPFGCGCYMPVKAMLKDAECWLAPAGDDRWLTETPKPLTIT